jgi:prepilin-type N-terminal cleavage/methylation domain-containing protein
MANQKAFTLMELIVAVIILGVLTTFSIPMYLNFVQQGQTQAAQNNLLFIYGAENNYYFNNTHYCLSSDPNPTCGDNLADINANLGLNISDNVFTYQCTTAAAPYAYVCTATNPSTLQTIAKSGGLTSAGGGGGNVCAGVVCPAGRTCCPGYAIDGGPTYCSDLTADVCNCGSCGFSCSGPGICHQHNSAHDTCSGSLCF